MLQMEKFYSSFFSEIIRKYLQVIANRNPAVTISVNKWAFSKQYIRSFHSFLWLSSICVCVCVCVYKYSRTLTWWLSGEESTCQCRYMGLIPGSGRSHGEGNGNPLEYSCLGNSMDGGTWWPTVHRVAKSRTRLSNFTSLHFNLLDNFCQY